MAAATRKEVISKVYKMVPPMLEKFHKGMYHLAILTIELSVNSILGLLGRVGVIGGSEDYTGAPYFSAMASARLGCDMVRTISVRISPHFHRQPQHLESLPTTR